LFPETERTLMIIDKDIYQYSVYLNSLRQSFVKDMTNQFINLQKLLNQEKYKDYFSKNPELGSIKDISLFLINEFSAGKHPGEVNDYLFVLKEKKKSEIDYNDYYKLFNSSLELIELSSTICDLPFVPIPPETKIKVKNTFSKLIYVSHSAGDLFIDVRTKNY